MPAPLDQFIPSPDARERHTVTVNARADVVHRVARAIDIQSIPLVHTIFAMRARFMRSKPVVRQATGFIEEMQSLGWGILAEIPGELIVAGAVCRPWEANVVFRPVPPGQFADFREPGLVKIAWTLETERIGLDRTRLATETRVAATDAPSRTRFLRYWRWARFRTLPIRWLLLPAIRREAERRGRG